MKIQHKHVERNGQHKLTAFIQVGEERLETKWWMSADEYKNVGARRKAYVVLDDRLRARAEQHGIVIESSAAA